MNCTYYVWITLLTDLSKEKIISGLILLNYSVELLGKSNCANILALQISKKNWGLNDAKVQVSNFLDENDIKYHSLLFTLPVSNAIWLSSNFKYPGQPKIPGHKVKPTYLTLVKSDNKEE